MEGEVCLKEIPTKQLVEELSGRDGIEQIVVEPYIDETISVNGPAIILVVID